MLHSQSWKIENWRSSCMKDDTCLFDPPPKIYLIETRSQFGPEGMINWDLQLNNSQLENSFNSLLEKHHVSRFPNQPNPNPIQSVIDRWNLRTQNMFFVDKGKPSRSQEIDDKRLQKELGSSDRTGKPVKLSEDIRVNACSRWNRRTCEIERKHTHSERTICFLQNIVTLHHLTRTTSSTLQPTRRISTSIFQECRLRWWNDHMASTFTTWFRRSRTTLSATSTSKVIFNNIEHSTLSAKESQDVIKAAGNTEVCEIVDVEPKAQCRACLAYWDVGIVYCTCGHFLRDDTTENKKYMKSVLDHFSIPNFYIRKGPATRSQVREERRW